jgi:MFS family permease
VYLLAVALGLVLAVDGPTNAAFGAELVPADDLPNAIALGSVANSIGRIAGMSLAGALVGVVGCGPIFVANGVSYLAVVVALASLDVRALRHVAPPPRREAGVRAGLRVALRSPAVVTATVIAFFVAAFGRNYQVTMAAMSDAVFATGARGYGELSVVFAVGAFCGGLVAARMRKHTLLVVVAVAGAASALQLTSAFAPSFLAFATCIYPIAIAAVVFDTAALSVVQLAAPDGHRARVVALLGTVSMLGATAGGPTLGWMADRLGGRASLGLGALVVIAGTAVVTTVVQRARLREIGSLRGIADELARRRTEVAIAAGS